MSCGLLTEDIFILRHHPGDKGPQGGGNMFPAWVVDAEMVGRIAVVGLQMDQAAGAQLLRHQRLIDKRDA